MNRLQNNRGAVSVSYAALIVFSVAALVAIAPFYDRITPLCDEGPLDPICSGLFADSGEEIESDTDDQFAWGDPSYDPDPSTPMAGPWIFGAGQMYSSDEESRIYQWVDPSEYRAQDWYYNHPGRYTNGRPRVEPSDAGWDTYNEWFDETRGLKLDDAVNDCPAYGVDDARWHISYRYCEVWVRLQAREVRDGLEILGREGPTGRTIIDYEDPADLKTVDYGTFYLDGNNQPLDIKVAAVADFNRTDELSFPEEVVRHVKVVIEKSEEVTLLQARDHTHLVVDARGGAVGVDLYGFAREGGSFELGNGYYESNNPLKLDSSYNTFGQLNGDLQYVPAAAGVVAAYPYIAGSNPPESFEDLYTNGFSGKRTYSQHRIYLANDDRWSIKECTVSEVPFVRPDDLAAREAYGEQRLDIDETLEGKARKGASIVMENGAGETWELIYVDRPAFTDDECSLDNTDLFIR